MKTRRAFDEVEHSRSARPGADFGLFAAPAPVTTTTRVARTLNAFEERRPTNASLAYVRGKLVELYAARVVSLPKTSWFVTADDADGILKAWSEFPSGGNQSWRGSIFRIGWEKTGQYIKSDRPHMNATDLPCWRPRGAA